MAQPVGASSASVDPPAEAAQCGCPGADRDARLDGDEPGDTVGSVGGEPQRPGDGVAVGDHDGAFDPGRVEHGQVVREDLGRAVAPTVTRTVGSTRPHAVGRDHGEPARQGWDQPLPRAGVGDR